jgi:hypothetical protein
MNSNQTGQPAAGSPNTPTQPTFRVGGVPVYGDAILAPMDGF